MTTKAAGPCFHCGLGVPADFKATVLIGEIEQPVCCPGCKAVAELIRDAGMSQYYDLRDTPSPGSNRPALNASREDWVAFDRSDMLERFAALDGDDADALVYVEGMYCSACAWLIESNLQRLPGVISVDVSPITSRLRLRWNSKQIAFSELLQRLVDLGYKPQPNSTDTVDRPELAERRSALKRLIIASLGMMQVMMFAVALYAGDYQGISPEMQKFFRLVSFIVATPVVLYAGRPFFAGAWRGLRARQPGMDVPVAIAIGAAYCASVWSSLNDGATVWFDSVTMFVFFLTLGRFLEMSARHRATERSVALSQLLPATAIRLADGAATEVAVSALQLDDEVRVRAGEHIPADGRIVTGNAEIDEALLTGESTPCQRSTNDIVIAGSTLLAGSITMRVEKLGPNTTLAAICRSMELARCSRPRLVRLADSVASYIVIALLLIAASVALAWTFIDPERAFVITLSVLVVTCPCALALATPAAIATASSRLSELGLLVTDGNAVETLARATHIIFDKTGTLTAGKPRLSQVSVQRPDNDCDADRCRQIAASLESASAHPIARAFSTSKLLAVDDLQVFAGAGISGVIDGRLWRIGQRSFVCPSAANPETYFDEEQLALSRIYLGDEAGLVATFELSDEIRQDAKQQLMQLRKLGLTLGLASGDSKAPVERVATEVGITDYHWSQSADDKLDYLRRLQKENAVVVMVGDGINDAPVLAGADTSIAIGKGALLAHSSAESILLGDTLEPIVSAVQTARRALTIIRQNLIWAVFYNLTALPLAAAGHVPPWAAAAGMSASSLVVVLNALRLKKFKPFNQPHDL